MEPASSRWPARSALLAACLVLAISIYFMARGKHAASPHSPESVLEENPRWSLSSGTLRQGGSLYLSLKGEGLSPNDVNAAIQSLGKRLDLRTSRPGHVYEIFRSSDGTLKQMRYWVDAATYYEVNRTSTGLTTAQRQAPMREETLGAAGSVQSSLWEAMQAQGVHPELIYAFADLFAWRIDFLTEPRQGDTFKVLWSRKQSDRGVQGQTVLAALYNGRETGQVTAVRFGDGYYMPGGQSLQREFLRAPLKFRAISSRFTKKRFHPVLRIYRPHHGIDFSAPRGTPVSAIGDGVVTYAGWKGGNGKLVKLRHGNTSYESGYGHLSRFAKGIKAGARVAQGQVIGYVGSTGLSTGPHLHFGFEKNGQYVDFFKLKLPSRQGVTDKKRLAELDALCKDLLPRMDALVPGAQPAVLARQ